MPKIGPTPSASQPRASGPCAQISLARDRLFQRGTASATQLRLLRLFQRGTASATQLRLLVSSLLLAAAPLVGCAGAAIADSGEGLPAASQGPPRPSSAGTAGTIDDQSVGQGAGGAAPERGTGAPTGSGGELTAPTPGTYRGTYFVPVPDELTQYALFEIRAIRIELEAGELMLRYDLPALLIGDTQGLTFSGTSDASGTSYFLEGDEGHATCSAANAVWSCDEVLPGLQIDRAKIERKLADLPAPEAEARRAVADRFAVDPIGVLSFDMAPTP